MALRVLSYNIRFGGTGREREISEVIRSAAPDVVMLQEAINPAVVESLAALGPDDVDMLVCGSRGYGPVRRVLLGGVSSPLIRRAQLPVTVVPRATTGSA